MPAPGGTSGAPAAVLRMPAATARPLLLAYAMPAFVLALPTIPVFVYLPTLYGVHSGLGLAATGLALLAARLFDAVTDPLVGALCDRIALRGRRRKPWIAAGAAIAAIGLLQVLDPPPDPGALYLFGWSAVLYAGWTMVSVPYLAWGAELSADYDERTRIAAWREGLGLAGIAGAGALAAAAGAAGWSETESVGALAWAAVALGALLVPAMLLTVPEPPHRDATPGRLSLLRLRAGLASLAGNRPFLRLLFAWFVNGLANGVPAALFLLYLEHGIGAAADDRPLFILVYFAAAIAAVPLWQGLSRRIGKHRAWCWAMIFACAAFATVPLIPAGGFAAFAAVCAVTGMALGADLALPPAIQADVVDYDALRNGRARTGLLFALWSLSAKLALALAVGTALPALSAAGFDPAAPSPAGLDALTVIYALVPVVIKLTAIAAVWRFPLTARRQAIVGRRLRARRTRIERDGR